MLRGLVRNAALSSRKNYCGSEFIRECGGSGTEDIECADVFANEFAPTQTV
jgi:hypothetical protein